MGEVACATDSWNRLQLFGVPIAEHDTLDDKRFHHAMKPLFSNGNPDVGRRI
jgi:hypothetical protein